MTTIVVILTFISMLNTSLDSLKARKVFIVEQICNNFATNRAFYDKSMKLGTGPVDNNTKKLRVSATLKMSSYCRHLVFFQNGRLFQFIHYNLIIYLQTSCILKLILLE